jgi:hypothetical protein
MSTTSTPAYVSLRVEGIDLKDANCVLLNQRSFLDVNFLLLVIHVGDFAKIKNLIWFRYLLKKLKYSFRIKTHLLI